MGSNRCGEGTPSHPAPYAGNPQRFCPICHVPHSCTSINELDFFFCLDMATSLSAAFLKTLPSTVAFDIPPCSVQVAFPSCIDRESKTVTMTNDAKPGDCLYNRHRRGDRFDPCTSCKTSEEAITSLSQLERLAPDSLSARRGKMKRYSRSITPGRCHRCCT